MKGISRETFEGMDDSSKLNVLFDFIREANECACNTEEKLEELKEKFEQRKWVDTSVSAIAGVVGGAAVWLGKTILGKS